jgi:hypothetical protein
MTGASGNYKKSGHIFSLCSGTSSLSQSISIASSQQNHLFFNMSSSPLLLDGLNEDSFRHVLGFMDSVDLSRLECVCRETKQIAESHGWDILANRHLKGKFQPESTYPSLSKKDTMIRWTIASNYASRNEEEINKKETSGPNLTEGLQALWNYNQFHDYFFRLSDGEKCMWEGFVPFTPVDKRLSSRLQSNGLDVGAVWDEEGFDWYKQLRKNLESHPGYTRFYDRANLSTDWLRCFELNATSAEERELMDDLRYRMRALLQNKTFTFVAVERIHHKFVPTILMATTEEVSTSYVYPYLSLTEKVINPVMGNFDSLKTCFLLDSFTFFFDFQRDFDYYDSLLDDEEEKRQSIARLEEEKRQNIARLEEEKRQNIARFEEEQRQQIAMLEEEQRQQIAMLEGYEEFYDHREVVASERALTRCYTECVQKDRSRDKNKNKKKYTKMLRNRKASQKKSSRRGNLGELVVFDMLD